jgi:hypothetical protein
MFRCATCRRKIQNRAAERRMGWGHSGRITGENRGQIAGASKASLSPARPLHHSRHARESFVHCARIIPSSRARAWAVGSVTARPTAAAFSIALGSHAWGTAVAPSAATGPRACGRRGRAFWEAGPASRLAAPPTGRGSGGQECGRRRPATGRRRRCEGGPLAPPRVAGEALGRFAARSLLPQRETAVALLVSIAHAAFSRSQATPAALPTQASRLPLDRQPSRSRG